MFWAQGLMSLAIWLGFGWALARHLAARRQSIARIPRALRATGGPLLLVGSMAILVPGLSAVHGAGGIGPTAMTPMGWLAVTLIGLATVLTQGVAASWIASHAMQGVTARPSPASINQEQEGPTK